VHEEYLRKKLEYRLMLEFDTLLHKLGKRNVILAHANADLDAVGAAIGLAEILETYGVNSKIIFPEGPSRVARELLEKLNIKYPYSSKITPGVIDSIIVVDTANPVQLHPHTEIIDDAGYAVVIDHHKEGRLKDIVDKAIVLPEASSTSEIIATIARNLSVPLNPSVATLVYAGIISDTAGLRHPGVFTFIALDYLYMNSANVNILRELHDTGQPDLSERIAIFKALSRLSYARICKEIIIAITHIGSHESQIARKLIELSGDVAVVVKDTEIGVRIAIKVSKRALENGIRANEIALYIAEKYGGEGGGHDATAMVAIRTMEWTAERLSEHLGRSLPGKIARLCTARRKKLE